MKKPELPITIDESLDPGTAEATVYLDTQERPMIIRGEAQAVVEAASTFKPVNVASTAIKAVTEPQNRSDEVLTGRRATIAAKLYDLTHRTNMYDLLKQKREDERNLAFATRLGLISLEDVSCQKHHKAIAKLHGMVEQ